MSYQYNKQVKNYIKIISKNLLKYNKTKEQLSQNIIKKLIFHKKSHYTSLFIEYLIWDDFQEFLTRYYTNKSFYKKIIQESKNNYNLTLIDDIGHRIIFHNFHKKKLLQKNILLNEKKLKKMNIAYSEKKLDKNNFFHILPPDISGEKKIFEIDEKNSKNESETIDNINANNDISMSLDLRINKNYDTKILDKNSAFVKGKNGENDKEIMKVIKFLKPIHNENICETKKIHEINNKNRVAYYEYLNYITRDKNKYINHSNNINEQKTQIKENINDKNNYINQKSTKIKGNTSYKNIIFKIDIKKNNPSPVVQNSRSKKKIKNKNNRNIILINKIVNNTTSTKTNSKFNETFNASNSKNKMNNSIKNNNQTKTQNNKIANLKSNLPFSSKINEKKVLNSNSNPKKNFKNNDGKIKKLIIDKNIISTNLIIKEKYIKKKFNFISPEIRSKNYFNRKKNFNENKLLMDKIIYKKKEKSFDNKHSMKDSTKNSTNKLSPSKCKKIL